MIRLFAPVWKGIGQIELKLVDSTQTLVRFCLPGYPDEVETGWYEDEIRMALPPPAVAIRLMDIDGDRQRALTYLGHQLHEFRLQHLRDIQSKLVNAVGLSSLQGLPIEKNRHPDSKVYQSEQKPAGAKKTNRDIPNIGLPLRDDVRILLRLWQSGHTAKEIAIRTSRTEKTILNQLTLLCKSLGEEMVPRRR